MSKPLAAMHSFLPNRRAGIWPALLSLLPALILPQLCSGQVAIYDLTFQRSEEQSVNFAFFDGGYLALDLVTGTGCFLLTYREVKDGIVRPSFVQTGEAAEAFTAIRDSQRMTVIRATALTGTAIAHYLAIGGIDHEISAATNDQPLTVQIASRLTGHVLASDDESDVAFAPGESAIAFAGMAALHLTLNPDLTSQANRSRQSLSQALETLVRQLEGLGFKGPVKSEE